MNFLSPSCISKDSAIQTNAMTPAFTTSKFVSEQKSPEELHDPAHAITPEEPIAQLPYRSFTPKSRLSPKLTECLWCHL